MKWILVVYILAANGDRTPTSVEVTKSARECRCAGDITLLYTNVDSAYVCSNGNPQEAFELTSDDPIPLACSK